MNVLIIEDDTLIAMDLSMFLEDNEFNVVDMVTNYKDAIEVVQNNHIDLILSDIQIESENDGIDAVGAIQAIYDVPAIFITSFSDDTTLVKASGVNMLGYIVKPYRQKDLLSLLKIAQTRIEDNQDDEVITINEEYSYVVKRKELKTDDSVVELTTREKLLFDLLFFSRNSFVSYEQVENVVWYGEIVSDNSRRQLMSRLKKKLPGLEFETIKNSGYKLSV